MHETALMLHCSNPGCQAENSLESQLCQKCSTPLVLRYLWAVGEGVQNYRVGEAIADRYLLTHPQVVLDTKPGFPPQSTEEIPDFLLPYLRLSPYRLHLPQVYGRAIAPVQKSGGAIWLLEYEILPSRLSPKFVEGQFFPSLLKVWPDASPLRQLNWLWQMAQLWQPLADERVVSSLLNSELLRANGGVAILRELQADGQEQPSFARLGQLWQQWVPSANATIQPFLQQLCEQLIAGKIEQAEQLVAICDRALEEGGRSQTRRYQIYTQTDRGPNRKQNEDACYPSSGKFVESVPGSPVLAIVCDGIGGHDGGEIASHLAIETLQQGIEQLSFHSKPTNPALTTQTLELSTCKANDALSERNDREQRQERQRMGTTLVMVLAQAHEMYATHVGDSRIYWVTRSGCHQITLDDDVASREVRMGYALYREALQYPSAGALVQALGMGSSARLRPTVNRTILDEDCVFLLCSDGLSDYDRVDQYWETEILPILNGKRTVAKAGERLVEIANTRNGHDNVTVALIHCQVQPIAERQGQAISLPTVKAVDPSFAPATSVNTARTKPQSSLPQAASSPSRSQRVPERQPLRSPRFFVALVMLLGLGLVLGGLSYWLFPELRSRLALGWGQLGGTTEPEADKFPSPTSSVDQSPGSPLLPLQVGDAIEIQEAILLYPTPAKTLESEELRETIPAKSILKVLRRSPIQEPIPWLELQVCSLSLNDGSQLPPAPPTATDLPVAAPKPAIQSGWVQADARALRSVQPVMPSNADTCPVLKPLPSPPARP